jgi:hypothetical protein
VVVGGFGEVKKVVNAGNVVNVNITALKQIMSMSDTYVRFTEAERQRLINEGYRYVLVRGVKMISSHAIKEQLAFVVVPLLPDDLRQFQGKWIERLEALEVDELISMTELPVFLGC